MIEKTYNHDTYYLMATIAQPADLSPQSPALSPQHSIVGILPLVHMRHFLFGNKLVSIPFFDMGGILADNEQASSALLNEAKAIGRKLKVESIELRHTQAHAWSREPAKYESGVRSQESGEEKQKGSRIQGFKDSRGTNKLQPIKPT